MALQSDNAEPHRTENFRRFQHQQPPVLAQGVASAETIRIFI